MKNERLLLFILAVVQFSHIVDFMIVMPLGKQLMTIFDITPQQFTLIVASYSFAAFVAGLVGAFIIDKYDRKYALLFTYIGFSLATIACAFAPNFEILLLFRSISGLFGGSLATIVLAIIGDVIPYHRRSTAMGIIMTAFSVASVVGVPIGISLAAQFGWQMPFLAVGGMSVLVSIGIFFWMPSIRVHLEKDELTVNPLANFISIFKNKNQGLALLFTIVLMLGHFTIIPFIAPYMQFNLGFSDMEVSYIYFFGGLSTVIALPLFGKLGDRFGNFPILLIASVGAIFSIFAITNLMPVGMWVAILVTTSYFVVASGRNVPATTMVTAVVKAENRGSFMSVRTSAQQLALGSSSLLAGAIVVEGADGVLVNYEIVGYIAIGMSILAVVLARYLKVVKE
jgi:DHA1 family inner membrane transport protein